MSSRVAHRGPDGAGAVMLPEQGREAGAGVRVGLAHRRLAILDPDPRANQPFTDQAGRWIVFNGEIYNFRQLREALRPLRPEYDWRTHCDTEALLIAYDAWGADCVSHLSGMFSFAIWDAGARRLLLARDRMGQKPLYFSASPDWRNIAFASELPALLELPWVERSIDRSNLVEYLRRGYVPGGSIFSAIDSLPPARTLLIEYTRDGVVSGPHIRGYFDANQPIAPDGDASEAPEGTTRRLVMEAVRAQLISDVPPGCFLSGGAGHHMNDEGFGPAQLDKSSSNADAIRGREQQLIDQNGGAQSQGGTSGNKINGISPTNPNRTGYLNAAQQEFGQ